MAKLKDERLDNTKTYVEKVADKIIDALKNGTAPWVRPWKGGELSIRKPINPLSNKAYKGINMINLYMEASLNGYEDPRWVTYKQAQSLGGQVKPGEKGVGIQYWKFLEDIEKTDSDGNPIRDENGQIIKITVELEKPRVFFATVFNAQQIDGMPELKRPELYETEVQTLEHAEQIILNSGAKIEHREQGRAFYSSSSDRIIMPLKTQFANEMGYYGTLLHELGHWTGHTSRLNRPLGNMFGTPEYAQEELRAEIASFMLCSELSIDFDPENHMSYIDSWVSILQDKPNEIFKAAADAGKITQFLQGFGREIDQEQKIISNIENPLLENTFLEVSYSMKNEAKALGARWDKETKLWYAPEGSDRKVFEKFIPQDQSQPKFLDAKGFMKSPTTLGRVELYEVMDSGAKNYHLLGGDVETGSFNATWYFDQTFSERVEAEATYKRLMPSFDEKDYAIHAEILGMVSQASKTGSVKDALGSLESMNKTQSPQLK